MVLKTEVDEKIKRITAYLAKNQPHIPWAFVCSRNTVYYTAGDFKAEDPSLSPVVVLLQQIFEEFIDHSFFILRERIYTNYPPSAKDLGMVKVVGKRISQIDTTISGESVSPELPNQLGEDFESSWNWVKLSPAPLNKIKGINLEEHPQLANTDVKDIPQAISYVKGLIERGPVLHDYDREIVAILVNHEKKIVDIAVNSNHLNKSLHAEVNLIQKFTRQNKRLLPKGFEIWVSHKPCKMCAGMIYDCSEEKEQPFVFYYEDVLGRLSQQTILDEKNLNQKIDL
ncbi:MAG: Bd3614 family nucleic acid deaminase [Bdellovibrionia bacterium]